MSKYYGNWGCKEDITNSFNVDASVLDGAEILMAAYHYEDYSGGAFVLFEKDGKWFEQHGSHCSCNGLEECPWEPEEVDPLELLFLLEKGDVWYFHYEHRDEMVKLLQRKLKRKSKKKQ